MVRILEIFADPSPDVTDMDLDPIHLAIVNKNNISNTKLLIKNLIKTKKNLLVTERRKYTEDFWRIGRIRIRNRISTYQIIMNPDLRSPVVMDPSGSGTLILRY
jgi:hypothetical protein